MAKRHYATLRGYQEPGGFHIGTINVVRLLPDNPDFEPIVVDLRRQSLTIEGIGVGVLRSGKL